jgi:hypothetical protein
MSEALVITPAPKPLASAPAPFHVLPWRDPHSVPPGELALHIQQLEDACLANPQSADLRTCLGMAHAVNHDVYKSMDALEAARAIDPENFWAQLKYGELHYRLRALKRAEEETRHAVDLATNPFQLAIARRQLKEIRTLQHTSVRNVEWTKPLTKPALVLSAMLVLMFAVMMWK